MLLLFSNTYQLLGEFFFAQGRLNQFSLSAAGENAVGEALADWRTQGIPMIEHYTDSTHGPVNLSSQKYFGLERFVQLTDQEAELAFSCWVERLGFIAWTIPERLLEDWHHLCRLDLSDEERFVAFKTLLGADHATLSAWRRAIHELLPIQR